MLLVLLPFLSMTALGDQEGDFQFQIDGAGAVITRYLGPGGAVVIPDHLGGNPVTSIGRYAFSLRTSLTGVTIPDSVTYIWDYAFYGCIGLTSATIGNGVTSIEPGTFAGCTRLTNLSLGMAVTRIAGSTAILVVALPGHSHAVLACPA